MSITKALIKLSLDLTGSIPKTTQSSTVIVKGTIINKTDNTILLINGSQAAINANGLFESAAALNIGENKLLIKLYNGDILSYETSISVMEKNISTNIIQGE